jgi:hypothetical protein
VSARRLQTLVALFKSGKKPNVADFAIPSIAATDLVAQLTAANWNPNDEEHFFVACLLVLALTTSFTTGAAAKETHAAAGVSGREVSALAWSAACMTDHGPSICGEPIWVYGVPLGGAKC